ncbi:MAG: LysR substrate-binding domain-containing protein [Hyphomicrobiales bacterium]
MGEAVDPVLRQEFLDGMSHTACTVNVVTTDGPDGRAGVTVSAMSSVSADTPRPSLLVCVHHMSSAAEKIVNNGVFCVNVLQDHQSFISDTFAGRRPTEDGDKFSCAEWTVEKTGAPRVVDPLVAFDCKVVSSDRIGTHHVLIGEVETIFRAHRGSPLIFANRAYGSPTRMTPVAPASDTSDSPGRKLSVGCFHTFGPFILPALLARMANASRPVDVRIADGDERTVVSGLMSGETELALLYDIKLGDDLEREALASIQPYVLLADGHPLTEKPLLEVEDLADEPFVLLDARPSRDYFMSMFEQAGVEPKLAYSSTSFEMVRGLVGHGLGVSILATKPASAMTYDGKALRFRPLKTDVPASQIVMAWRKGLPLSDAATEFAECCRAHFGSSD